MSVLYDLDHDPSDWAEKKQCPLCLLSGRLGACGTLHWFSFFLWMKCSYSSTPIFIGNNNNNNDNLKLSNSHYVAGRDPFVEWHLPKNNRR